MIGTAPGQVNERTKQLQSSVFRNDCGLASAQLAGLICRKAPIAVNQLAVQCSLRCRFQQEKESYSMKFSGRSARVPPAEILPRRKVLDFLFIICIIPFG